VIAGLLRAERCAAGQVHSLAYTKAQIERAGHNLPGLVDEVFQA
jgi:hypothetical protein